jgi:hypothetical protein
MVRVDIFFSTTVKFWRSRNSIPGSPFDLSHGSDGVIFKERGERSDHVRFRPVIGIITTRCGRYPGHEPTDLLGNNPGPFAGLIQNPL